MAEPAVLGMERHLRYAPSVDPGDRQNPTGANAADQSLVAGPALCDEPRTDHLADTLWGADLPDRFRFHRPPPDDHHERWRDRGLCAAPPDRRRFLQRDHAAPKGPWARHSHLDDAGRDPRSRSVRAGPGAWR